MVQPWYKQFWAWFIIGLTLTTIVSTLARVYILSQHSISLVSEDYYKKGKGINIDISKVNVAKDLSLGATIITQGNDLILAFEKGDLGLYPALNVSFAHRTLPDRDFSQLVTANGRGEYKISLDSVLSGPWFIEVSPHDHQWLIQGKVTLPTSIAIPVSN
jgi:hypothetical protein